MERANYVSLQPGSGHSGLCHPPSQTDGRTGRQLPGRPLHIMEALYVCPLEQHGVMMEEEEQEKHGEQEEGGMEASSPVCSITDEETDEDSEPEPPPVVRRKVSFADAFGLDLVSVKEFDKAEVTESEVSRCNEREVTHSLEEFYVSCLFTVPSSSEELDQRLQAQMVELESIELLPGTTILRGTIRVVNLCYSKCVYARISLDRWNSYFDLLAEYVPGSSDRETDRFTFKYTLVPPFEREGTRMDFCLRYETSVGTFWANNKKMNYVLFCHQNGHVKKLGPQMQEESSSYKSKRSCLKAKRIGSTEGNTWETINTATVAAEVETTHRAEKAVRKTKNSTEMQSLRHCEEHKSLVEGIKNRHAATRLACVHHYLSKRRAQIPRAFPHDSANGQKVSQPVPALWGDSADFPYKCQKTQPKESPQVLTYHQIPLLTLDWNSDKQQQWGAADVDDIWTGGAKTTLSKASEENTPSVKDMWETFLNGIDVTNNKETSVCDVWQAFPNGPSCKDRSSVPESEWLQTAASVSPSNNKGPQNQCAASSQEFREFQTPVYSVSTEDKRNSPACM
ncbi:protein phosphatase 1 regulatory subunit 3A-like [Embiotoca jacksoni]|uniref:protein phosphatase 1 regulatory subunit 3A-like n=1 Tax=Embiotoca jacksoni TaxID=100190 RepID=UPI0037045921